MPGDVTEKEAMILQAINDGATDTVDIKDASTLTNRQINWRLVEKEESLVDRGLVNIEQPDGWERRKHADREREHWAAKRVSLTDHGVQTVAKLDDEAGRKYEAMSHDELVEHVNKLEKRLNHLEIMFRDFRGKVMDELINQ